MRTRWIQRFDTVIAPKPVKPGVFRRKEGGLVIRARIRDPRTGKDHEIRRILAQATADEALAELTQEKRKIADRDTPPPIPKIRFSEYAQALYQKKVTTGQIRSAASRRRWQSLLKHHLLPRLGDLYMSELRRTDLLAYQRRSRRARCAKARCFFPALPAKSRVTIK